jgi:hypothetical protein
VWPLASARAASAAVFGPGASFALPAAAGLLVDVLNQPLVHDQGPGDAEHGKP